MTIHQLPESLTFTRTRRNSTLFKSTLQVVDSLILSFRMSVSRNTPQPSLSSSCCRLFLTSTVRKLLTEILSLRIFSFALMMPSILSSLTSEIRGRWVRTKAWAEFMVPHTTLLLRSCKETITRNVMCGVLVSSSTCFLVVALHSMVNQIFKSLRLSRGASMLLMAVSSTRFPMMPRTLSSEC